MRRVRDEAGSAQFSKPEPFARIHVSIYGLTETENLEITKHAHHRELAPQMRRRLALKRSSGGGCEIVVGFRTLCRYSDEDVLRFQEDHDGEVINQSSASADYCNWGNSMGGDLPGHAQWVADVENSTPSCYSMMSIRCAQRIGHHGPQLALTISKDTSSSCSGEPTCWANSWSMASSKPCAESRACARSRDFSRQSPNMSPSVFDASVTPSV
jgi:hypothetical protein